VKLISLAMTFHGVKLDKFREKRKIQVMAVKNMEI
jgi:hypothetical protein